MGTGSHIRLKCAMQGNCEPMEIIVTIMENIYLQIDCRVIVIYFTVNKYCHSEGVARYFLDCRTLMIGYKFNHDQ